MRKLLLLFSLLVAWMGVGTVSAQNPDETALAVQDVPEGYYYIQNKNYNSGDAYLAANGSSMKLVTKSEVTTDHNTSSVGLWYVKYTGETKDVGDYTYKVVTVQSLENNYYMGYGPACPLVSSVNQKYALVYDSDNSAYKFYGVTNNGSYVVPSSTTSFQRDWNDTNDYRFWNFIPATSTVSFNYTHDNHSYSFSASAFIGDNVATAAASGIGFDYVSFPTTTTTITNGTTTYDLGEAIVNYPFEIGKFYKVNIRKNGNTNSNVTWDGSSTNVNSRSTESVSMPALWRFELTSDDTHPFLVKMVSHALGTAKYLTFADMSQNNSKATMSDNGTAFLVNKMNLSGYDNGFRLTSPDNNTYNINDVGGSLGVWVDANSATDGGSCLTVTLSDPQPIALKSYAITSTANSASKTGTLSDGYYWLEANVQYAPFMSGLDYYTLSNNAVTDGAVIAQATPAFPFTISTTDSPAYHYMNCRNSNTNYICESTTASEVKSRNVTLTDATTEEEFTSLKDLVQHGQWSFYLVDGTFNRFYITNRTSGKKMTLASDASNGTSVTMTDEGTPLYIVSQPSAFTTFTGGFNIQLNADDNHAIGDHKDGQLSYWSNRGSSERDDGGSIFLIKSIDNASDLISNANTTISSNVDYDQTIVGNISTDAVSKFTSASYDDLYTYFNAYDAFLASSDNVVKISPDKLYTIRFNRGTQYLSQENSYANNAGTVESSEATPRTLVASSTATTPAQYFRFVSTGTDGVYHIENVNSGQYWGKLGDGSQYYALEAVSLAEWSGSYSVDYNVTGTRGELAIKCTDIPDGTTLSPYNNGGQYLFAPYDNVSDTNGQTYKFANHLLTQNSTSTTVETGVVMKITEVTSHPLTISSANYATLCLPFEVQVPSEVTAMKATTVGDDNTTDGIQELTLTDLDDNVIPANTGVILSGTAGDYTLTVNAAGTTAAPSDNLLTGTTVKRTGFEAKTYYSLAKKTISSESVVGFFLNAANVDMSANKAFLEKSTLTGLSNNGSAQGFRFKFGGIPTGINNAITNFGNEGSNIYYDLNGRRVLYPTHGVYVKGNGQKVYIQ